MKKKTTFLIFYFKCDEKKDGRVVGMVIGNWEKEK